MCKNRKVVLECYHIEVEAGRWHNPNKIPYTERKCQLCNTLEDEFHFYLNVSYIMILENH